MQVVRPAWSFFFISLFQVLTLLYIVSCKKVSVEVKSVYSFFGMLPLNETVIFIVNDRTSD